MATVVHDRRVLDAAQEVLDCIRGNSVLVTPLTERQPVMTTVDYTTYKQIFEVKNTKVSIAIIWVEDEDGEFVRCDSVSIEPEETRFPSLDSLQYWTDDILS